MDAQMLADQQRFIFFGSERTLNVVWRTCRKQLTVRMAGESVLSDRLDVKVKKNKVGDRCRGLLEGSLFDSYNTEV